MGEPGTKEPLSLEELQAADEHAHRAQARPVDPRRKQVRCPDADRRPVRQARLQHRHAHRRSRPRTRRSRASRSPSTARIHPIDQVTKQLHKLVNVLKIRDLEPADTVARELALFKVTADGVQRGELLQIAEIFRGKVVDVTKRAIIIEITGTTDKIARLRDDGAPVRADRDDAHGRDRDLARAQRDLGVCRPSAHARGSRSRHRTGRELLDRLHLAVRARPRGRRADPRGDLAAGSIRRSTRPRSSAARAGPASGGSCSSSPTADRGRSRGAGEAVSLSRRGPRALLLGRRDLACHVRPCRLRPGRRAGRGGPLSRWEASPSRPTVAVRRTGGASSRRP